LQYIENFIHFDCTHSSVFFLKWTIITKNNYILSLNNVYEANMKPKSYKDNLFKSL